MNDYFLGGKDNYEVNRAAADEVVGTDTRRLALNNRAFLARAVTFLAEAGIEQFTDLGSGIPTAPSPHDTARAIRPGARVAYVDEDPVVLAHSRAMLEKDDGIAVIRRDALSPQELLDDPALTAVIDLDRPVGLLAVALFHFAPAGTPNIVLAGLRQRMAPGSWLALSTFTSEGLTAAQVAAAEGAYAQASRGLYARSCAGIEALFDGFELTDPGVVDVSQWRASDPQTQLRLLAGLAQLI